MLIDELYIGTINKITDKRVSFSCDIDNFPEIADAEKKCYETGVAITPESTSEIFEWWFSKIKEEGYWSPWMEDWTSATIYRLFRGNTAIDDGNSE